MSRCGNARSELAAREREHQDAMLDEALGGTFPASDPIAISIPSAARSATLVRGAAPPPAAGAARRPEVSTTCRR